jgi:hypothetical protein
VCFRGVVLLVVNGHVTTLTRVRPATQARRIIGHPAPFPSRTFLVQFSAFFPLSSDFVSSACWLDDIRDQVGFPFPCQTPKLLLLRDDALPPPPLPLVPALLLARATQSTTRCVPWSIRARMGCDGKRDWTMLCLFFLFRPGRLVSGTSSTCPLSRAPWSSP